MSEARPEGGWGGRPISRPSQEMCVLRESSAVYSDSVGSPTEHATLIHAESAIAIRSRLSHRLGRQVGPFLLDPESNRRVLISNRESNGG